MILTCERPSCSRKSRPISFCQYCVSVLQDCFVQFQMANQSSLRSLCLWIILSGHPSPRFSPSLTASPSPLPPQISLQMSLAPVQYSNVLKQKTGLYMFWSVSLLHSGGQRRTTTPGWRESGTRLIPTQQWGDHPQPGTAPLA